MQRTPTSQSQPGLMQQSVWVLAALMSTRRCPAPDLAAWHPCCHSRCNSDDELFAILFQFTMLPKALAREPMMQ
eukprot:5036495-Amphidinium_carterae.1